MGHKESNQTKKMYGDAYITAADISSSKLATGSGINIPTPIPHSLPSILPPQIVPTIPIKKPSGVTPGHNTPNIHIPTPVTQTAETTGSVGDNSSTTGNFTGFGVTQKQTGTFVIVFTYYARTIQLCWCLAKIYHYIICSAENTTI